MSKPRSTSFGTKGLTIVDVFGVWLSKRSILKALDSKSGLRILELGCGFEARNLVALGPNATALVGVDFNISENLKNQKIFEAFEGSIEDSMSSLESRQFDVILMISVLEHLTETKEILRICHKMLAPDGLLLINVPTWRGKFFLELSAFRFGFSPVEEMDDHKMYYDKRDLWPLIVGAGFKPSKIKMNYHKFSLNLFAKVTK